MNTTLRYYYLKSNINIIILNKYYIVNNITNKYILNSKNLYLNFYFIKIYRI